MDFLPSQYFFQGFLSGKKIPKNVNDERLSTVHKFSELNGIIFTQPISVEFQIGPILFHLYNGDSCFFLLKRAMLK
jgi:hypothetical protein